ncbi:GNAT family N-acetyltransferase [Halogeometricum limi]|uniref:Acetyltransferase (GNAT) family protein n=1 Tax=Halogeometricum limi TaxID=555875 RepID=A0A1I6IB31_9EURY|nr:GNAT family N-acetyltransferase [Halogeometricum limi]SFR63898.1 Acetyltransferase (GNAT) family protein [Halogeometricum limi]
MDIEIRRATTDDGPALLDLWHGFTEHLSQYDERYQHKEDADDRWLQYFENQLVDSKYGAVFVAEADDDIVGVIEARLTGDHPIFRLSDHGYINGHYVVEEHRDEGVGDRLVEAAVDWFGESDRDITFCRVDVIEGDDHAQAAYERMGFSPVEHVYERQVE